MQASAPSGCAGRQAGFRCRAAERDQLICKIAAMTAVAEPIKPIGAAEGVLS
jgi:hypothetical protein